jgi:hypothetical protein
MAIENSKGSKYMLKQEILSSETELESLSTIAKRKKTFE